MIRMLKNEVPTIIPGCGELYCSWDVFKKIFKHSINCDFKRFCKHKKNKVTANLVQWELNQEWDIIWKPSRAFINNDAFVEFIYIRLYYLDCTLSFYWFNSIKYCAVEYIITSYLQRSSIYYLTKNEIISLLFIIALSQLSHRTSNIIITNCFHVYFQAILIRGKTAYI